MRTLPYLLTPLLGALLIPTAHAQSVDMPPPAGTVLILCANNSSVPTPTAGKAYFVQCDNTGKLLTSSSGGSGSSSGGGGIGSWFVPSGAFANLSVATTTSNVALPSGAPTSIIVQNTGTNPIWVNLGTSAAVTATTTGGIYIAPTSSAVLATGSNTYIAAISTGGTSTLLVTGGSAFNTLTGALSIDETLTSQLHADLTGSVPAGTYYIGQTGWSDITGTNTAAVKPASTLPVSTDPAGVVTIRDPVVNNDPCIASGPPLTATFAISASTQIITAGGSSKKTYICSIDIQMNGGANTVALVEGTGSVCATNIYGLAGGTTAANGWSFAANSGLVKGNGTGTVYNPNADSNAGTANTCLLVGSATLVVGSIGYVQK